MMFEEMAILNPDSLPYKILVTFHTGSIVTTTMSHQEMLHQEEMTSVAARICCSPI